jgi:hypothetical protein
VTRRISKHVEVDGHVFYERLREVRGAVSDRDERSAGCGDLIVSGGDASNLLAAEDSAEMPKEREHDRPS